MTVVELYREQLKATACAIGSYAEPTVLDFIRDADISTRLRNALAYMVSRHGESPIRLEDVKEQDVALIRNIGPVSFKEFVEKRSVYLREWQSSFSVPTHNSSMSSI